MPKKVKKQPFKVGDRAHSDHEKAGKGCQRAIWPLDLFFRKTLQLMQEIYYFSFLNGPNQVTAYEEEKPVPKILTSQPHRCQPNWFTKEITNLDGMPKAFAKNVWSQ